MLIQLSAHTAHEMDNMTVELHVLVEIYFHPMTVAAQIIARQVYQHHVLGILLRVVAQEFGSLAVLLHISCASGGSGNRVNERLVAHDAVMGFRRRTEDAETAEVEIEEVRRRVDAAQRTVEFEIIALIFLYEAATHHNLEHISAQAVLYASAYVCLVLLIGERRGGFAHRVEIIRFHICLVHRLEQFVELWK